MSISWKKAFVIFSVLLVVLVGFVQPAAAQVAASGNSSGCVVSFLGICSWGDFFGLLAASVANAALTVASWLVAIAGSLLNVSIVLTLHIRDLVNSIPAIYSVWTTIRDVTGLFFIFFLLYAAFKMILFEDTSYGSLLKDIVVAGILINFSFFLTSVAIDASNIISQALYNAMLPQSVSSTLSVTPNMTLDQLTSDVTGFSSKSLKQNEGTMGISDIFANSLKLQTIYDTKGTGLGTNIKDPFKILLIGVIGVIIMITTAISFVLAAGAFIVRLVILLFLLAFSPLWFAASVIPEVKQYTQMFRDQLKSMLIFMPVYLLLMYAALRIVNESKIWSGGWNFTGAGSTGNWAFGYVVIAINFAMIIVMLNMPLFVAASLGGYATKFINTKKWGAQGIWGRVGVGTIGWGANKLNESSIMRRIYAQNPNLGASVSGGLGKVSKASFGVQKGGYDAAFKAKKKAQEELYKHVGTIDESKYDASTEKGKEKLGEAKAQAKAFQAAYREELPKWSLLNTVKARANRQTAHKLSGDARKEQLISDLDKNQEELNKINAELPELKAELPKARERDADYERVYGVPYHEGDRRAKRIAEMEKRAEQLKKDIADGKRAKGDKNWKQLVTDAGKEIKDGEGEEKKDEKKEEKK